MHRTATATARGHVIARLLLATIPLLTACGSTRPLDLGSNGNADAGPETAAAEPSNPDAPAVTGAANQPTQCTTKCRVFVSSELHDGNFGGLAGADALCNRAAQSAGVGGTWTAWLADSKTLASARVHGNGPWYLMDQTTLAFANHGALAVAPRSYIDHDEAGHSYMPAYVWSGTNPRYRPTFCDDWTSTSGTGTYMFAGDLYGNITDDACANPHSIICFEQ